MIDRSTIVELVDLLRLKEISFPPELDDVRFLTPFAVSLRYGDLPAEPEEPFDRDWAADRVRPTREWVTDIIQRLR